MKEVKVVVDGKEYTKTNPVNLDVRRYAQHQMDMIVEENGSKRRLNPIMDEGALEKIVKFVCDYVGAPTVTLTDDANVKEWFDSYRQIDANLLEAVTGKDPNAGGR